MYLKINGELFYLWRAVDQHGVVLDILVQSTAMPQPPSASSSTCWPALSTSRVAS
ncbi:DDE domain-containing protein [Pseudoroseomonas wenyumeiae]|uniref:DDE domain-containing protein n=1 Tax=Teichococcus wenyumeiae TaxID=2478470 RepID=A0ABX9VCD3_9PROT|nr:DDE domain-containing protein [Pseudoroseomonas wenyumeiae]